jgi:hypothetical protein
MYNRRRSSIKHRQSRAHGLKMARATEIAWCRQSERTATHKMVDHPWPRVAQQETLEPHVA